MITMPELLEDKAYYDFIVTKPRTPKAASDESMTGQWVVYFRKDNQSPWKRKAFFKYKKALKFFFQVHEAGYYDFALANRRIRFNRPKRLARIKGKYIMDSRGERVQVTKYVPWKPKLSGDEQEHLWCGYCRRPTIFKYFTKHHALKLPEVDSGVTRCSVCGASSRISGESLR